MTDTIVKVELNKLLHSLMGRAELVDVWWYTSNAGFDNQTPDQVYQTGPDGRARVKAYILQFCT